MHTLPPVPWVILPWGLLIGATGCGASQDEASWALQHAAVELSSDGTLTGYQTWEMYSHRWQRKQDSRFHLCAVVESISGVPLDAPTCPGCVAGFLVTAEVLETDCPTDGLAALGDAPGAEVEYLIGEVPADLADLDLQPGRSLGWFLRWAGEAQPASQGFVWPAGEGDGGTEAILEQGGRLTFWPAYAWDLETADGE